MIRLKNIPRNERDFFDFSLGHCDSFLCNTNTWYVLGPNKSVVSSELQHNPAVTPRLSRAHLRNIYQRAIHSTSDPRSQSVFNNGRHAMQGRIDFEAKVRRKAASSSPTYMSMCACVCVCVCVCVCQWILTLGRGPV